jgi:hypothetical protein
LEMKSIYLSGTLAVVLLSLAVVSAFAAYPPSEPGIPTNLQPPVLLVPSDQIAGQLCFHYADGRNVTLTKPPKATILATSTAGSITLEVFMVPLFNGTNGCCYSYSLNGTLRGFPTGQVTLYLVAGSLTDSYGRPFPSVNTLIGTILVSPPGSSSPGSVVGSSAPSQPSSSPSQPANPGNPPGVYRDAQATSQESKVTQPPPNLIPVVLVLLVVAGAALVLVPRRRR